ncbi:prepilin-type N-terminal cleavage/methylation domain-containing protein [Bradyrhizobium sp. WYCCWR 13023]|uniref:Prepilin-type N-terminal cleavage/methylation domain-containing protein n=1 Tax=Bradyrhizobium zhengyangense TaxID=2911009 RepID=A0A9X1RHX2_9BRAD|nr:prepilin-type N-terminal cleavage/methylation domain-containing protein [Bradyrhizobium zhengyangense]
MIGHKQVEAVDRRRSSEQGFALLEILIAFLILALGLGALAVGVAVALRSDARTNASRTAMRLAQSRLEMAGITTPLVPGHREGLIGGRYKWEETISEVHMVQSKGSGAAGKPADGTNLGATPFWVEIAVRTPDGVGARIAALKLGDGSKK